MNKSDSRNEFTITRLFNARIEKVFAYFTDPELLSLWHTPNPDVEPVMAVDLSVGGSYRFEMTDPAGQVHVAVGTYRQIQPNEKLVFTWKWEGSPHPDTVVTIHFREAGESTEITLHHTGFTDTGTIDHHNQGWIALFGNLEQTLAQ
jgi:uncharacterized protein YndB with AHSA1/START domain